MFKITTLLTPACYFFCLLLITNTANSYHSFLNTGHILDEGQVQATAYLEAVLDDYDGANLNVRGSMSLTDELQVDIELGSGEFDLHIAGYIKWVPIPDYEEQPAIGVRGGLSYMKLEDFNETSFTLAPFVSKMFPTHIGRLTPFVALPFGLSKNSVKPPLEDDTYFMVKMAIGSEWSSTRLPEELNIIGEMNFDLSKSFNSINIGASYRF